MIACEPSGDQLGALLMRGLRAECPEVELIGLGGPLMEGEGLKTLFDVRELALNGVFEVLPKAPMVLRRVRETLKDIEAKSPDVLVTIDSWGFTGRIHERLTDKGSTIPRVRCVAPQVWAWRPGRAKQLARWINHLLTLLPFEPPYFTKYGLPATWIGHPVLESGFGGGNGAIFRAINRIPAERRVIAVLPGSRHSEVSRLLPVFKDAVALLAERIPELHVVMPTVSPVAAEVEADAATWRVPVTVVTREDQRRDAIAAAEVALAASGTVSLELAMAGVPHIIAYRTHPLTGLLLRLFIRTRFVNLINILVDHEAVPERLLGRCRADILADDVGLLLRDETRRVAQRADFAAALKRLSPEGELPSRRGARTILSLVKG